VADATPDKDRTSLRVPPLARGLREGALIVLVTAAVYLVVALVSFSPADPGWSHTGLGRGIANRGGLAGAYLSDVLLSLFGYMAYLFPLMVGWCGWLAFRGLREPDRGALATTGLRALGFVLTLTMGSALAALHVRTGMMPLPLGPGGILGDAVGNGLVAVFSFVGATLFMLALFLTGVTLFSSLSWLRLMDLTGRITLGLLAFLHGRWHASWEVIRYRRARRARRETVEREQSRARRRAKPRIEPKVATVEPSERAQKERQGKLFEGPVVPGEPPPLSLLDSPPESRKPYSQEALEAISRQVELKLRDFGVEVEVVAVHPGPVVTRFELQPAAGVKVSQISNLSKDLARALSAVSVRVVEVIPGKSVVGLEIPNEQRELVCLSEILRSREYDKSSAFLTLALGKDISGYPVVADLARMPHLLVAGTTGSGKSVAINAMLLSLLYKSRPEQVRLILIDPKMLELSVYDGIQHLLAPVVTDMKEAGNALRWCVAEMERRYRLMASVGVRNLAGFNRKVKEAAERGEPIADPLHDKAQGDLDDAAQPATLEPLPYIVVVVDELADLMMVVGKKVEELIARLAQKARASGIHLILATQRPSVDVITGLIKANIPTRIAFQVSSRVDSRTILDQMGAEQLLGHGDMLYLPPGTGSPTRVHGAFVGDHEVHAVVSHLKKGASPQYLDEVLSGPEESALLPGGGGDAGDAEQDPLYDQAVRVVTETRKASISGVQRRLRIGYNRAARLVEQMESAGIVGPLQGNGSREVLAAPPPKDDMTE